MGVMSEHLIGINRFSGFVINQIQSANALFEDIEERDRAAADDQ